MSRFHKPPRFSAVAAAFVAAVVSLGASAVRRVLEAAERAIGPARGEPRVIDGRTYEHRELMLTGIVSAAPSELRREAMDLTQVLDEEANRRGAIWRREGAHLALRQHVISPLAAALEKLTAVAAAPEGGDDGIGRAIVELRARVAALEAAAAPVAKRDVQPGEAA